ncbi:Glycosyltransferase family 25 (LPS biosynthesis protein) [Sulfitobacter sp. THAF37]|uniref:glycosyltransferase family 25 protein n=1 Tax=Sulfitobacter sp. THAF37 TaxID=2587855 RepID=UPI00126960EC|nr:glycosyltransferase family 25 protein [Sulfitobacter sp. THAF37]QFT58540.1 Glycosyltransferase family 25 (LPS biosynthesis protein) [Sulfitobacter sp. THAF37]
MQSLIIHMPGPGVRADNVARLLEFLPMARVVPAVDGREALAQPDIDVRSGDRHAPPYPFPMAAGEVGCFLSHRKCWQEIAEGTAPYALIAEDDLTLDPAQWAHALALVAGHATEQSFIRLPAKNREARTAVVAQDGHAALYLPRVIGLQTVCQVVGRAAARRLLAATDPMDRPVDTTLQMHWVTGQPVHTVWPSGVGELPGASTIQKKTGTGSKLKRELQRAIYRARVRARPQRA